MAGTAREFGDVGCLRDREVLKENPAMVGILGHKTKTERGFLGRGLQVAGEA